MGVLPIGLSLRHMVDHSNGNNVIPMDTINTQLVVYIVTPYTNHHLGVHLKFYLSTKGKNNVRDAVMLLLGSNLHTRNIALSLVHNVVENLKQPFTHYGPSHSQKHLHKEFFNHFYLDLLGKCF